jgi:hypothetical protein
MVFKAGWGSISGGGYGVVGEDGLLEDGAIVPGNGSLEVIMAIWLGRHCIVGGVALLDDGSSLLGDGSCGIGKGVLVGWDKIVGGNGSWSAMPLPLSSLAGWDAAMGRQEWPKTLHLSQREGFHS